MTSEADLMVVLNELRHIHDDVLENKQDLKDFKEQYRLDMKELREEIANECNDCKRLALLEFRLQDYEETRSTLEIIQAQLNTSKHILYKMIPYVAAFLAWLAGGGWRFFA